MNIRLVPVNDENREAVLALSVREDQPFVAPNDVSLRQADEANAEQPGVARPFAVCADEKPVGFCMFAAWMRQVIQTPHPTAFMAKKSARCRVMPA